MERKILNSLLKWKNIKNNRLPLLIYGARQVGKTYTLRDFGERYYKNVLYINFEKSPEIHAFFDGDLSPNRILGLLGKTYKTKILKNDTLIIFDEIQTCERALTSLKYFAEEEPDYHIVGAGSLLGVAINRENHSFPVGKVIMETMYPLDFEEFLLACGQDVLISMIKENFDNLTPMPDAWHAKAMEYYKIYNVVGGMPAVVIQHISENPVIEVNEMQKYILDSYIADMTKYTTATEGVKIREAYSSIPAQLMKDNKKFQYKVIQKGANASMFGDAIEWLISSGIVIKCSKTEGLFPPAAYVDPSAFKLYMSDIGLLSYMSNISLKNLIEDELKLFSGGLAENYVACTLKNNGYKLFYWESKNTAEVDFFIVKNDKLIPIEVKANLHSKSKSLESYKSRYNAEYAIRISAKNFGFQNNIKAVPLYAAFLI